jgi:two-component system, response regulator PdtaR
MQRNASHRTTVLIVEDEILLRMDAMQSLESAGLIVVEAGSADEAISILEERDDIHLVFTDIHMPGSMDGLKLAHFVRDRWPPIRIIATSGHAKIDETDLPQGCRFIPKPYRGVEVAEVIHHLIL